MIKDKIMCSCCGNEKQIKEFYSSNSHFHKFTQKIHICKECFIEYIEDDVNKLKNALRMIDKPFILTLFHSSLEEAEKSKRNPIRLYMKNVGMNQYKELTWEDSEYDGHKKSEKIIIEDEIDDEYIDEITKYWGKGYSDDDYEYLEDEKLKLMTSFECPDYGMEMIMKDICFINLDIEKTRQERKDNSQKIITNLIETRSKLMNDANMKPIQSTGSEANDQVTFGTLIRKWENEKPVPKPLDDEMKRYIDTYMVGHLAKMEGLNNDMTKKYDEAMSEYTINFSDINRDNEEFDD